MLFAVSLFVALLGVGIVLRVAGGRLGEGSGVSIIGGVTKTRKMSF